MQLCLDEGGSWRVEPRTSEGTPPGKDEAAGASDSEDATNGAVDVENREQSSRDESLHDVSGRHDVSIAFFGTGSAEPNKYRGASSIYIHRSSALDDGETETAATCFRSGWGLRGGVLLDCGEGTYGGFIRRYGRRRAIRCVRSLNPVAQIGMCTRSERSSNPIPSPHTLSIAADVRAKSHVQVCVCARTRMRTPFSYPLQVTCATCGVFSYRTTTPTTALVCRRSSPRGTPRSAARRARTGRPPKRRPCC